MRVGIIGLPRSGKTTIFNAVALGLEPVGGFGGVSKPNIRSVAVPDFRIDRLAEIYKPKRTTYATVEYVDFPTAGESLGTGEGLAGGFLNELAAVDALIHVVRGFQNEAVPHPEGSIDPARDIEILDLELALADLAQIERRIERMDPELRTLKAGERGQLQALRDLLGRMRGELEGETPVRAMSLDPDERRLLAGSQFLTEKPLLDLLNVGEEDLPRRHEIEEGMGRADSPPGRDLAVMGGRFEMELNELSEDEAAEFREAVGVEQSGMAEAVLRSYGLLGLISFLTVGPDECRAWTVTEGANAPEAAGKIHTDLQRGFIRAEVIRYEDLIECGSEVEAKRRGLQRTEGKDYKVQDGDVVHVLFNV
ncbi:MAG TPA: redox-regulated ATPase YchF [Dehalococcoidia bacterium]|nr:redox-regulated ATPase YchF [Dehalococcoidia bacterium]|tara:strand:+ start:2753 stop:3850 length:1098 start_codon:yes stop_codon:yes gene_type:complete